MQVGLQADMTCVRSDGESFATRARPLARSYVIACLCPRPSTPTDAPPGYPSHPFILSMLEHRPLHQELRLGRGNRDILYVLEHRPLHQDLRLG